MAGEEIRLAGIRRGASEADLVVQETSRSQARVQIEYLNRGSATGRDTEADEAPRATLELTIHNASASPTTASLVFNENGVAIGPKTISLAARETRTIEDVAGTLFGRRGVSTGWVAIEPRRRSMLAVTARVVTSGGATGSVATVPVVATTSGLRLGQAQLLAGVDDARQITIDAKQGGTVTTTLGFAETAGKSATVHLE